MPPSRWVIVTCATGFSWREAWKSLYFNWKKFWPGDWGGLDPLGPPCLRQWVLYFKQPLRHLGHLKIYCLIDCGRLGVGCGGVVRDPRLQVDSARWRCGRQCRRSATAWSGHSHQRRTGSVRPCRPNAPIRVAQISNQIFNWNLSFV